MIYTLTTDQHLQICFLKKNYPEICHQFDVWHKSKGIKKKLFKAAKKRANTDLMPWIRSTVNHFWWHCATCEEDHTLLREKWVSTLYHVIFMNGRALRFTKSVLAILFHLLNVYLKIGGKLTLLRILVLKQIVLDKKMINDLVYFVKFKLSGDLECYHNLLIKYCPKRLSFTFEGMVAWTQVTVLDHNDSIDSKQATTATGELRFKTQHSKVTDHYVYKKIMEPKEETYITEILDEIKYGDKSEWNYGERKKKVIAKIENPGNDLLLKNVANEIY